MSSYLERLKTKIQKTHLPMEPTKPSKDHFDPFVGDRGRHVSGIDGPAAAADSQERRSSHVPKVTKAPSGTFGTSEDGRLSPLSGRKRLLAEAEAAEDAQFREQLILLREENAKAYSNPTPWTRTC
jgi:hypothetical protein